MGGKPDTGELVSKTVIVLGGGLAGLSAARSLMDRGYRVTLVEKRPFLGGRAYSFYDPQVENEVDNGQHIFMGCCTYYLDFLKALGAVDKIYLQDRLRAEVVLDGELGVLSSTPFLGALHLLPSFIRYRHIGFRDKILVVYGLLRVKLANLSKHFREMDQQSFHEWMKRHHQTDRAIDNLWNLIILPTLNDDIRNVSAAMGLMVLREGLLKKPRDATIGYARVGLTSLTGEPAKRYLEEGGGVLLLGRGVRSVVVQEGQVSGVELSDGSVLRADGYVSALPFGVLLQVLPDDVSHGSFFANAAELDSSPIVGIHLWYDRPIMDQDFVAFLDSPIQWVFNRTRIQGQVDDDGQYLCISVSGAWDFVSRPKDELRDLFIREMERLFPRARGAGVRRVLVVKQPEATFRSTPGAVEHRPSQATPIPNLFLAGDWTDTGWPATMEGAVRSGVFAADALASRL